MGWTVARNLKIAGLYIINRQGVPKRIGFALANEFSDHKMEQVNYLYLAHSKLRSCSFGPEILLGELPDQIGGKSRIVRNDQTVWEKEFLTGEKNMTHNIANLEHHHFKYELFRQPGDVHVHFLVLRSLVMPMDLKQKTVIFLKYQRIVLTCPCAII